MSILSTARGSASGGLLKQVFDPGRIIPLAAVAAAILIGLGLVSFTGVPIPDAVSSFIEGAVGSPYSIAASINRSVIFALVGLGFVLAARANLTNVGGEGQIAMGGIFATAVAVKTGVSDLPLGLAFILPLLVAVVAGAAWGALAGVLKVKVGTNEVISTLLLSFIAVWLLYWCVQSNDLLRQSMTTSATLPQSAPIPDASQIPLLTGDYSMPLNLGLPLTLVLAVVIAVVLNKSVFGLNLAAVGANPVAARRAGIAYGSTVVLAMSIAGAFGGLAGALMLQGEQWVLKDGFSSGYGFDGLVVGLLARGSVTGVIAGALLFGFLRSGGIYMEMTANVPSALVTVIQGLIVVMLAGVAFWLDRRQAK